MRYFNYLLVSLIFSSTVFCFNNQNTQDEWVVYFDGDLNSVNEYAKSHDLILIGKVNYISLNLLLFKIVCFLIFQGW